MSEPPEAPPPIWIEPHGHPVDDQLVSYAAEAAPAPPRPRRPWGPRLVFWTAVVAAIAAVAGGGYLAETAYAKNTAPKTVVADYLAALARADASAALSYGDLPSGSQVLLTNDVLAAQVAIAPITGITIGRVDESGDTATVDVHYELGFSTGNEKIDDTIDLRRADRIWQLDAVAVPVSLHLAEATRRGSLAGAKVPTGTRLVFPGAMPIEFDTDALTLNADSRIVTFTDPGGVAQEVELSDNGAAEVAKAVDAAMAACLDGSAAAPTLCPLPADPRAVPGTLRGSTTKPAAEVIHLLLEGSPDGLVHISGEIPVTGDYSQLDFNNQRVTRAGTQTVPFIAICYVTSPGTITWQSR